MSSSSEVLEEKTHEAFRKAPCPLWGPEGSAYRREVHEIARRLLAAAPNPKPIERQLLDVRCYPLDRVARTLSHIEVSAAAGILLGTPAAVFWTMLKWGATGLPKHRWHEHATPNLEESRENVERLRDPAPARVRPRGLEVEVLDDDGTAIEAAVEPPRSVTEVLGLDRAAFVPRDTPRLAPGPPPARPRSEASAAILGQVLYHALRRNPSRANELLELEARARLEAERLVPQGSPLREEVIRERVHEIAPRLLGAAAVAANGARP